MTTEKKDIGWCFLGTLVGTVILSLGAAYLGWRYRRMNNKLQTLAETMDGGFR